MNLESLQRAPLIYLAREGCRFVSQVAKGCTRSRVFSMFRFRSQQVLIFLVLADNLLRERETFAVISTKFELSIKCINILKATTFSRFKFSKHLRFLIVQRLPLCSHNI